MNLLGSLIISRCGMFVNYIACFLLVVVGVVVVVLVVVVVKLLSDMELVVLLLHEDNANVVMSAIRINFILLIFISSNF